jgi:hypothetical protein
MRLIVFLIRAVSFNFKIQNLANKLLLSKTECIAKRNKSINKKELLKLNNTKIKALFNSLPYSNIIKDLGNPPYGLCIDKKYTDSSGIIGCLYQYKNSKILIHNTSIKKWEGIEGIVYKNDQEYFRFTDKTIGDNSFLRTIGNTTIKYVKNQIIYIDSKINSKLVEPLKIDLVRDTNFGTFDIETALDINNNFIPVSCG